MPAAVPALEIIGLAVAYLSVALAALAVAAVISRRQRATTATDSGARRLSRRAFLASGAAASLLSLVAFARLAHRTVGSRSVTASSTPRAAPGPARAAEPGIWISPDELATLRTDVPEFERLEASAAEPIPRVDLSDQDSAGPQRIMAAALVAARLNDDRLRRAVRDALDAVIGTEDGSTGGHPDRNRPLGIGRNLSGYVIAADIITLHAFDPPADARFRSWIDQLRTKVVRGADSSLADSEPRDHSNWGAYISASMTAVNLYLADDAAVAASADILRGWLGDRAGRQEWVYDPDRHDYSWQCHFPDVTQYLPVNPPRCERDGLVIDGIIPIDMQRGGGFRIPPVHTRYPRESLHGRTLQAEMLHRAGFAPFEWGEMALGRIAQRLLALSEQFDPDWYEPDVACYRIIRRRTALDLPLATPSVGRSVAGVDWTVA